MRQVPVGMLLVMRITDEGRQRDIAIPWAARNRMSSIPVLQTPQAMVVNVRQKVPIRYIFRPPTISATDPNKRRVHPHERAFTEAGQRTRASGRLRFRAMVGRETTSRPASMEFMREMQATLPMRMVALHFEVDGMPAVVNS